MSSNSPDGSSPKSRGLVPRLRTTLASAMGRGEGLPPTIEQLIAQDYQRFLKTDPGIAAIDAASNQEAEEYAHSVTQGGNENTIRSLDLGRDIAFISRGDADFTSRLPNRRVTERLVRLAPLTVRAYQEGLVLGAIPHVGGLLAEKYRGDADTTTRRRIIAARHAGRGTAVALTRAADVLRRIPEAPPGTAALVNLAKPHAVRIAARTAQSLVPGRRLELLVNGTWTTHLHNLDHAVRDIKRALRGTEYANIDIDAFVAGLYCNSDAFLSMHRSVQYYRGSIPRTAQVHTAITTD